MSAKTIPLPIAKARQFLEVDGSSESGLRWKVDASTRAKKGARAGSLDNHGYYYVKIDGVKYKAHRLVWAIANGEIPDGMTIDHIDRNTKNNSLENLRIADYKLQAENRSRDYLKLRTNCGSLTVRKSGRIDASICINSKRFYKSGRDKAELIKWMEEVQSNKMAHLLD
ncbi:MULTISPECIES: HNH endonuclease [Enterobacteriaceae]|uniref:HNH endonuclease n=1 Tax=Enterobacteriaceae TaxID=543 RepID=UPI0007983ECC|nr:HNH endonuclease [Enterobacter hormaechei]CZZ81115.1 HNH endonuclease [Enterobacter hormaechei]SAG22919.1 HNH endonuclease [Enterobacter hormaechei]HEC0360601.1 HNH endonuclease [Enterobacter hormaechei]